MTDEAKEETTNVPDEPKFPTTPALLVQFLGEKLVEVADLGDFQNLARIATVQGQLLGMIASQPGRPKKGTAWPHEVPPSTSIDSDSVMKALKAAGVCL